LALCSAVAIPFWPPRVPSPYKLAPSSTHFPLTPREQAPFRPQNRPPLKICAMNLYPSLRGVGSPCSPHPPTGILNEVRHRFSTLHPPPSKSCFSSRFTRSYPIPFVLASGSTTQPNVCCPGRLPRISLSPSSGVVVDLYSRRKAPMDCSPPTHSP